MTFARIPRYLLLLVIALALFVAMNAVPRGQAQDAETVVEAVPQQKSVAKDKDVDVEIRVRNASNLGAFSFVLSVDPNVMKPVSVDKTDFLSTSGREISCPVPPTIDSASALYTCVTLRPTPDGVDGDGTMAIVRLHSVGKGTSELAHNHVKLTHPDGEELPSTTSDGSIRVASSGWFTGTRVAIIVAIAAVIVALVTGGLLLLRRNHASANYTPTAGGS